MTEPIDLRLCSGGTPDAGCDDEFCDGHTTGDEGLPPPTREDIDAANIAGNLLPEERSEAAGVHLGDEGLREGDAAKLRTLATWFDHFDDWREATGKIAPGIAEYREVQDDLRRIADALAAQENPT